MHFSCLEWLKFFVIFILMIIIICILVPLRIKAARLHPVFQEVSEGTCGSFQAPEKAPLARHLMCTFLNSSCPFLTSFISCISSILHSSCYIIDVCQSLLVVVGSAHPTTAQQAAFNHMSSSYFFYVVEEEVVLNDWFCRITSVALVLL